MKVKNKKETVKKRINPKTLLILTFFAFVTLQIIYTIQISSYGGNLVKLEKDYEVLAEENDKLTRGLANSTSLTTLSEEAQLGGYIKPTSIVYIKDVEFVASAR